MSDPATIPEGIAATVVDPECYASDEIFEAYKWLRQNAPFGRACVDGFRPFWVATKYDNVVHVSKDNKTFPYGDMWALAAQDGLKKLPVQYQMKAA